MTESRLRQRKGARLFLFNGGEGARFLCASQGVDMQSCGWRHRRTSICVLMNALRLLLQLITCINQCWRCLSLHPCFTQAAEEDPPCSPHSRPLQQQQALPRSAPTQQSQHKCHCGTWHCNTRNSKVRKTRASKQNVQDVSTHAVTAALRKVGGVPASGLRHRM